MKKQERWKKKSFNFNKECTGCKTKSIRPIYHRKQIPKLICQNCGWEE